MATATGINGLKHIAKVLITLMLLINVMDQLNISYTGILTLAGAGSLAGAFAAKEIVQNIFGGLVIFLISHLEWVIKSHRWTKNCRNR